MHLRRGHPGRRGGAGGGAGHLDEDRVAVEPEVIPRHVSVAGAGGVDQRTSGCIGSIDDLRPGGIHLDHVVAEVGATDAEEHVVLHFWHLKGHSCVAIVTGFPGIGVKGLDDARNSRIDGNVCRVRSYAVSKKLARFGGVDPTLDQLNVMNSRSLANVLC